MDELRVQVAYAGPMRTYLRDLLVPAGAVVREAIEQSGILGDIPEIDLSVARVGVFGKLRPLDSGLRNGDRVEIYRPLIADPKEARRRRAGKRGDTRTD